MCVDGQTAADGDDAGEEAEIQRLSDDDDDDDDDDDNDVNNVHQATTTLTQSHDDDDDDDDDDDELSQSTHDVLAYDSLYTDILQVNSLRQHCV